MIKINGLEIDVSGQTLQDYLSTTDYDPKHIAVEINQEIVSKKDYADTILKDGDVVEVVSFVGGG